MRRAARGGRGLQLGVATVLVLFSSCSRGPAKFPVTGTVVYPNGSPLKGGMVEFRGKDVSSSYLFRGVIGADGRFALRTADRALVLCQGNTAWPFPPRFPKIRPA